MNLARIFFYLNIMEMLRTAVHKLSCRPWRILELFLVLVPLWWLLGFSPFIYHLAALFYFICVLLQKKGRLLLPKEALLLFLTIFAYSASLLINSPFREPSRVLGSLFNLSLWVMGWMVLVSVYNDETEEEKLFSYFSWFILISGFLALFSFVIFMKRPSLILPSLLKKLLPLVGSYPILNDLTSIKFFYLDYFFSFRFPRLVLFSPYPNAFAALLLLSFPPALYLHYRQGQIKRFAAISASFILCLLLSLSRMSVLAFAIALSAAVYLFTARRKSKTYWAFVFAVLFAATLVFTALLPFIERSLFEVRINSFQVRSNAYREALRYIISSPVLGIGVKPRQALLPVPVGSHSTYIGLLLKSGILGTIPFIAFLVILLVKLTRGAMETDASHDRLKVLALFTSLLSMVMWMGLEDIDAPTLVAFLFFLLAGLALKCTARLEKKRKEV